MANGERVAKLLLSYEVDENSASRVVQSNSETLNEMERQQQAFATKQIEAIEHNAEYQQQLERRMAAASVETLNEVNREQNELAKKQAEATEHNTRYAQQQLERIMAAESKAQAEQLAQAQALEKAMLDAQKAEEDRLSRSMQEQKAAREYNARYAQQQLERIMAAERKADAERLQAAAAEEDRRKAAEQASAAVEGRFKKEKEALEGVRNQVDNVAIVTEKMNATLLESARANEIDRITQAAIEAAKETGRWAEQLEDVAVYLDSIKATEGEIKGVSNTIAQAANAQGSRGQGLSGSLRRIGYEVRALPAVPIAGGLSTDAIGKIMSTAGMGIDALGVSLKTLAVGAGITTAAVIAIGLALDQYNRTLQRGRDALSGALDGQNRYYQALTDMSSDAAADEINSENRRLSLLRQQREETQNALDSTWSQAVATFGDAGARALEAAGQLPTGQLREQLSELDKQISSTESYTVRLAQAYAQGLFSANDLIEAERRLAEERARNVQTEVDAMRDANRMTAAERQAEIKRIDEEAAFLELQRALSEQRGLDTAVIEEELDSLNLRRSVLVNIFQSTADALARVEEIDANLISSAEFIQQVHQLTLEQRQDEIASIEREIDWRERLISAGQLSADAIADLQAEISELSTQQILLTEITETYADQLEREAQAKELLTTVIDEYFQSIEDYAGASAKVQAALQAEEDARAEHLDRLAEIDTKKRDAEKDAQTKASDTRLKQAEDFERRRLEIERKSNAMIANAIGSRDALAYFLTLQNKQEELQKLTESDSEKQKQIDDALEKQNKATKEAAEQQTKTQQANHDKQLAQLQKATAAEQALAFNHMRAMQLLEQQYRNNALVQQAAHNAAQFNIEQQSNADRINAANATAAAIRATLSGASAWSTPSLPNLTAGALSGVAFPQLNLPIMPSSARSPTVNIIVNANGLNEAQAARVARTELANALRTATQW